MSTTALRIITAATANPITLPEAKAHLRVTHSFEDTHIQDLILAATDWAQTYTHRVFVDTQVVIKFDRFPDNGEALELVSGKIPSYGSRIKSACKRDRSIKLPGGNVTAVNDIDYTDADGNPQTLTGPTSATPGTDYQEDLTDDEWPFIYPATDWPGVDSDVVNAVSIDYQVGWALADIPAVILQAIKFKTADLYTIRDTSDAGNKSALIAVAENLLEPYVVPQY